MMLKIVLVAVLSAGAAMAQDPPGQPYASYWFPAELLTWTPAGDSDAPYNRSGIQLSIRSCGDTQCNAHATCDEGGVSALSIMYPSTSFNPSQGGEGIDSYAFNYWQYTDNLTFWGGSAGEGLILAPNPGVIDAGHRNGVPVYGTVFFPPVAYGGQIQWVWDFVQKTGSVFPVADKLIEMTEYYGFDGWFINQETAGGDPQLAGDMRDMMIYIQENSDLDVQWYDAMTETGGISWQNALNNNNDWYFQYGSDLVSQWMFLNFWWSAAGLASSASHATALGRSPYELYAGVDVQANGYNTGVNWDALFPEGQPHVTSVGFYCPNWTYSSSSGHSNFYQRANRFWCGENRDPSNTDTSHPWKGLAHYFPARTPVTSFPFVTNFNAGHGYFTAVEGETLSGMDWHNRSQQDVLPTWRWISRSDGTALYPELCWDTAYHGGSCLKASGELSPVSETMLYLYKTDAVISSSDSLLIVWLADSSGALSGMELAFSLSSDPDLFNYVQVPAADSAGWNTFRSPIGSFSGSTMSVLGIRFGSGTVIPDYQAHIGRLGVIRGGVDVPQPPASPWVEEFSQVNDTLGAVRLRWDHSPSEVYSYNVYRQSGDGSRTFLWATPNNACFVPAVTRPLSEDQTEILIEAVSPEFGYSSPVSVTIDWQTTGVEAGPARGVSISGPGRNPVRDEAVFTVDLPSRMEVSVCVYDLCGRLVRELASGEMDAGEHLMGWNTSDVPAGIYIYRLQTPETSMTGKCTVLR